MSLVAFSAVALSLLGQAPDLNKPVTYTTVAVPVSRAVEELSKQTGVPMRTTSETGTEILVIHVEGVPLSELMKRIAATTASKWQDEAGTQVLVSDRALRAKQAADDRAKRIENLRKHIQERLKQQKEEKEGGDGDGLYAATGQFGMQMTMGLGGGDAIIWNVIPRLSLEALVDLPKGGRIVYSTNPTRMQRPSPRVDPNLVATAVKEHNAQVEAMANYVPTSAEEQRVMEMLEKWGMNRKPKKITGNLAKILFVVERDSQMGGLTISMKGYNSVGENVLSGNEFLSEGTDPMMSMMEGVGEEGEGEDEEEKKKPATPPGKVIELSETTKELMKAWSGAFRGGGAAEISDSLRALLLRPDLHDPLSFLPSDCLIFVAKDKDLNLVANLPDTETGLGFLSPEMQLTVERYLESMRGNDALTVEEGSGWIQVQPSDPLEARSNRANRQALAKLLMAVKDKETPSLDDLAEYAKANDEPQWFGGVTMPYLVTFAPSLMGGAVGMMDYDMLRLYGIMPQHQKNIILNGGQLTLSQLNPEGKALVDKMVYGAGARLQIRKPGQEDEEQTFFERMMMGFGNMEGDEDWRQEPTEALPNGLSPNTAIVSKVKQDYALKVAGSAAKVMGMGGTLGTEELGMYQFFLSSTALQEMAGMMPKIDELKVGERKIMNIDFILANEIMIQRRLMDDKMGKDSPIHKMDNLPPDLKAKLDSVVERIKKMNLPFFDPSFFRQQNPPPP